MRVREREREMRLSEREEEKGSHISSQAEEKFDSVLLASCGSCMQWSVVFLVLCIEVSFVAHQTSDAVIVT